MKRSAISWTDYSGGDLNFVTGCTPVSAGCRECYGRRIYERFGRDFSTVTVHPDKLERLRTAKFPRENNKRGPHARPMCFVCDTGDIFHEEVPGVFLAEAFRVMSERDDVDWIVLTKRAERLGREWGWLDHLFHTKHIWIGVTVENQEMADKRVLQLLGTSIAVKWVSVEPMLGPIEFKREWLDGCCEICPIPGRGPCPRGCNCWTHLNWVVCGAESGPNRRPFDVAWAADLKAQCDDAGVAYFGKQGSGLRPGVPLVIDGRVWHDWPEVRDA